MLDIEAINSQFRYSQRTQRGEAIRDAVHDMLSQSVHFVRATPAKTQIYMKNLKILLSPQGYKFTIEHYRGDTRNNYDFLSNWETSLWQIKTMEVQGDLLMINNMVAFKL